MKKLSKIKLQNAVVLENSEMKAIYGGSGGAGGSGGMGDDGICMAVGDYTSSGGMALCTNDSERAIAFSGESGWWCCNCQEAIDRCGKYF